MKIGTILPIVSAAFLAAAPPPAAAQDNAQSYRPTGPWALEYGEDYCRLMRTFSDGDSELALAFERIQPSPFMRMVLVGDGIRMYRRADTIGWHFTPSDAERRSPYSKSETPDGKPYYNLGQVTLTAVEPPPPGQPPAPPPAYDREAEQARAQGITGIALNEGLTSPVRVETESLGQPIAALQACADDLAKTWGLDPAKLEGSTPAIPEGASSGWLPAGTVPFADFPKFADGSNQVRLMVDAAGTPTSCHIHWPVLDESTNDKICSTLMEKAEFTPAKDREGQAMAGYFVTNPAFLLPPMRGRR